jgi:hypothetical protein
MPVLARLIYIADERVYPTDGKFRDIAKKVFTGRQLWNDQLDFTAPDIGTDLQAALDVGPAAMARFVIEHAAELRIPLGTGARLLSPKLVTTVRDIDSVSKGSNKTIPITEHYFSYALETVFAKMKGDVVQTFKTYTGGTLVLDDQWKAGLLINDPEILRSDAPGPDGALRAAGRAKARFESLRRRLGCPEENAAGWPFEVVSSENGPAVLRRKRCNIRDHVQSIGGSGFMLPFAQQAIRLEEDGAK